MANPETIKVYYDEEETRTESKAREELVRAISSIDGVVNVEVNRVFTNRPVESVVTVEFDESVFTSDSLEYEISTLGFVHNASSTR